MHWWYFPAVATDVEQTPDMQATHRPVVIPLRHARAITVEQQLRLLYKTQLTAGGKQPAMEIPSGADATVAASSPIMKG